MSSDASTHADAADEPHDTARAQAMLEPTVAAEGGGAADTPVALYGTGDLWEHGPAVTLRLDVRGCKPAAMYRVRVLAGSDCEERTLAAETWSAGDGIGDVLVCTTSGAFTAYYARRPDNEKPWTIGGSRASNVIGHALVVSEAETERVVTCGVIQRAPDAPFSETTDTQGPNVQIRGAVAGVCVFDRDVPKVKPGCPDFAAATACGSTYCELNRCIDTCATYVQCLAQAHGQDICVAAYHCDLSEECVSCQSDVVRCELDVCLDTLSCAEPASPDGPCTKLQQCCTANEADVASCVQITKNLARFGDNECQRLLESWKGSGKPCPKD